jgi:hypothetical protein
MTLGAVADEGEGVILEVFLVPYQNESSLVNNNRTNQELLSRPILAFCSALEYISSDRDESGTKDSLLCASKVDGLHTSSLLLGRS